MFDPFQTQRGPTRMQQGPAQTQQAPGRSQAGPFRGLLTDTSPDAHLLRPRSGKLLNAVKMLDKLTSGDEELYAYLSVKAEEEKPRVSIDPFAAGRGTAPPAEEDPLEELTRTPPPPVDTQEFQELKEELTERCRETIQEEVMTEEEEEEEKVTLLAPCGLFLHRIHTVDDRGEILRHYRPKDLDTPLLRKADQLLHQGYVLVEVRGDFPDAAPGSVLYAVGESGAVRKVIL